MSKNQAAWNKGLTKETDSRVMAASLSCIGRKAWNKGLSKETDIRVAKYGRKVSLINTGKSPTPEHKRNMSVAMIKRFSEHPEFHPMFILAKNGYISKAQMKMFNIVKSEIGGNFEVCLNYVVKTSKTFRFLDVAIPSVKLGFEFDGKHWHQNMSKDASRDKELTALGWIIAHINEDGLRYIAQGINAQDFMLSK